MAKIHKNQVAGGGGNRADYDFDFDFNGVGDPGEHLVEVVFAREYPNDKGAGVSWRIGFGIVDHRPRGGGKKPVLWAYFNQDRPGPWSFMLKALLPDVIDRLGDGVEEILAEQTVGRQCMIKTDWSTKDPDKLWVVETSPIERGGRGGKERGDRDRSDGRDRGGDRNGGDRDRGRDRSGGNRDRGGRDRDDRGGRDRGGRDRDDRDRDDRGGRDRDDRGGRDRDDDRDRDDRGRSETAGAMGVDTRDLPF